MNKTTWPMDKSVEDFRILETNLRAEGHSSRADIVAHLIERVKIVDAALAVYKLHIQPVVKQKRKK